MSNAPTIGRRARPARSAATVSAGWAWTTASTSGAGAQHLGVQGQLVRDRVAVVELARRARLAVEGHEADVLRGREREPALVRAAAAHEQPVGPDAQADVPEDAGGEAAVGEDPAGRGDELAAHRCVTHPRAPIPPSGWATSPVMPRARSEARKT